MGPFYETEEAARLWASAFCADMPAHFSPGEIAEMVTEDDLVYCTDHGDPAPCGSCDGFMGEDSEE